MKILYLVPHVPNPTKIRSHFHVQGLLQAGHDVTVATLERSAQDSKHINRLVETGAKVISVKLSRPQMIFNATRLIPTNLPLQSKLLWSEGLMSAITDHLKADPPDIIHVEHLRMAQYGLKLMPQWPVLWDAVDYLTPLYDQAARSSTSLPLRVVSRLEAPRLAAYERWLTSQFPSTIVISNSDLALFQQGNPFAERVHLAHTGIPMLAIPVAQQRANNILVITGTLNYHPNIASVLYFVNEIFPLIQQQRPAIHLQLVGANPVSAIENLRSPSIEVTGFVPSISEYLTRATIALAPVVYGSGMQIKVLEAFQTATPLVATSVALRGLDVQHEEHVLVTDTADDFAAAVLRLLDDPALGTRLGAAGRQYVEENHDLIKTTQQLVELYGRVIAGESGQP